jgi:hypothetical protein
MSKLPLLTALLVASLSGTALAQTSTSSSSDFPEVTFGVLTYFGYSAELHEADNFNEFDVTRGYLDIRARLSDRVRFRFTPDVRPTTDVDLNNNLALRLEYASLDFQVTDRTSVLLGLHEMPWLAFEESVNRYRVIGPFFSERLGLIPGPTDLGASVKFARDDMDVHVGVYNGEGQGRAELDAYKSLDGRVTVRPFADENLTVSGFYQYGWYARDRPRNVAIVMGSYEHPHAFVTAQYLSATDNPFGALDIERQGLSFFGEVRQGPTGWAVVGGLDFVDPDGDAENDAERRLIFGGAHWADVGAGRLGFVVTLEQNYRTANSQLLSRRLLAQTHVEF